MVKKFITTTAPHSQGGAIVWVFSLPPSHALDTYGRAVLMLFAWFAHMCGGEICMSFAEVAAHTSMDERTARTRVRRLVDAGLLVPTGRTYRNMVVYRVPPPCAPRRPIRRRS
ncbi:helix-turn-helix domain-containing protein [Cupriavidus laharis]|nr:hypothetical protein [Cupriavidus laharis]